MKRFFILVIICILILGAFVACNKKDGSDDFNDKESALDIKYETSAESQDETLNNDCSVETTVGNVDLQTTIPETTAHMHSFGEWIDIKIASCLEIGERTRICACGESENETVDALGHKETKGVCENCGEILLQASEGLVFKVNYRYSTCRVIGLGNCTDTIIVIPSEYGSYPVVGIDSYAFNSSYNQSADITTIIIPSGIAEIDDYAFGGCSSLKNVIIPDTVTYIGDGVFSSCTSLASIVLPDSITHIGASAFRNCSALSEISLSSNLELIYEYAFRDCTALREIIVPDSVVKIGTGAFMGCVELKQVVVGNAVHTIENEVFKDCRTLQNVVIGASVTSIGSSAFFNCRELTSISLPETITRIASYTFAHCWELTEIVIPNSVKNIEKSSFASCMALMSINMPESLVSIGEGAFSGCSKLVTINYPKTSAEWNAIEKEIDWDKDVGAYTTVGKYSVYCADMSVNN